MKRYTAQDSTNKEVVGKFKEEGDGAPWREFIGLRPKMYSMVYGSVRPRTRKNIRQQVKESRRDI